jgi:hypothetical protein
VFSIPKAGRAGNLSLALREEEVRELWKTFCSLRRADHLATLCE